MHINDSQAKTLYEDMKRTQLLVVFSTDYTPSRSLVNLTSWVTPVLNGIVIIRKIVDFLPFLLVRW
jgi:hypothetical protein